MISQKGTSDVTRSDLIAILTFGKTLDLRIHMTRSLKHLKRIIVPKQQMPKLVFWVFSLRFIALCGWVGPFCKILPDGKILNSESRWWWWWWQLWHVCDNAKLQSMMKIRIDTDLDEWVLQDVPRWCADCRYCAESGRTKGPSVWGWWQGNLNELWWGIRWLNVAPLTDGMDLRVRWTA